MRPLAFPTSTAGIEIFPVPSAGLGYRHAVVRLDVQDGAPAEGGPYTNEPFELWGGSDGGLLRIGRPAGYEVWSNGTSRIELDAANQSAIRIVGLAALDLVSTFRQALGPAYAVINAGASYSRRLLPVSDVLGGKAPALVTVLSTEDVNLPVRELLVGPTGLPLLATVAGATVSWQWELDEFVDRIPRPPAMDNQWFVETYRFRMAGPLGPTDPDVVDFDYISTAMTVPTRYLALSSDEDSVVVAIRHGEARSTRWNDGLSIQLGSAVGVIHITATSVAARDAAWHRLQPYVAADSVGRPVLESFALSQDRIREQRLEEERGRAQEVEDMRLAERELQRRGQEEALRRAEDQRRIEAQERKTERDKKDDREPRM